MAWVAAVSAGVSAAHVRSRQLTRRPPTPRPRVRALSAPPGQRPQSLFEATRRPSQGGGSAPQPAHRYGIYPTALSPTVLTELV